MTIDSAIKWFGRQKITNINGVQKLMDWSLGGQTGVTSTDHGMHMTSARNKCCQTQMSRA